MVLEPGQRFDPRTDHLFVLGRRLNDNGANDVLWQPGATRDGWASR